jgi:FMN-dependent NADH-azoreductase
MSHVLLVQSSPRGAASQSNRLSRKLAAGLSARCGLPLVVRDCSALPALTADAIAAMATAPPQWPPARRTDVAPLAAASSTAASDELSAELLAASVVVVATPLHNLTVAVGLKAWADHVARYGVTFREESDGSLTGLARDCQMYAVVTSGAVPIGSPADFATSWLRAYAGFLGFAAFMSIGQAGETEAAIALADETVDKAIADFTVRSRDE